MFEEIGKALTGRWGIAAAILLFMPGSRKFARAAAKEVIRAGLTVGDHAKDLLAEVKEEAGDVVAEVKAERGDNGKAKKEVSTGKHHE